MRLILRIVLLICSFSQPLFAQSEWFSINTNERSAERNFQQVFQIVNEEANEFVTFFQYSNFFVAYLHNTEGELLNTFSAKALPKYKNNYIGASINGGAYTMFFQNDYGNRFSALTIDFSTSGFVFENKIDILSNIESVIGTFEYKAHIYILTSVKRSSILKLHKLNNHKDYTVETYDFSNEKIVSPRGFDISLNHLLDSGYDRHKASLIENNEPGSLEESSKKNKLFLDNNKLILTNDFYNTSTSYISINLENGNSELIDFPKPSFDKKDRGSESNSFVLDNHLFSLYVTKEKLDFSIYDIDSKSILKSLTVTENDSITFKNSPIILERGEFDNYRELDKTKQFLRKVSNSNAGLFIYKQENKFIITLGCSETKESSSQFTFVGGFFGGLAFGITTAILTPSYYSYTRTKSTRIECLFDNEFNSINGTIPDNSFDRIKTYIDELNDIKLRFKSIFKIDGKYILGYFDKEKGFYNYILID
ncbi:hypothetical protein H8K90_04390 [Winogradskyella echinorum]|uniref:Uncharacterized protein n=1 Tax=Winogradskyella echinorum TaxID=538189 RepID=A0ABR6XYP7_9FLAO|nr:hypothetical protein [Winogradskyella echinorum]MBC3845605.1 hypothetical protein [Winogradskyella echinorum]MBC5749953.1 hypothetical protein [Winogradskyella echinorum]